MTERIIWAVATGEYSDYRVQAIFEHREDAEAALQSGYPGDIEEITFFAAGEQPKKVSTIRYYGWVTVGTGEVTRDDSYAEDDWVHQSVNVSRAPITVNTWPWPRTGRPDRMELVVEGFNTKRTHKAFTDALAKLRAECIEGLHGGAR